MHPPMTRDEVINGAIGPFDDYCDGYGNPGSSGTGYVCVLKLLDRHGSQEDGYGPGGHRLLRPGREERRLRRADQYDRRILILRS